MKEFPVSSPLRPFLPPRIRRSGREVSGRARRRSAFCIPIVWLFLASTAFAAKGSLEIRVAPVPKMPPRLEFSLSFEEPSGNGLLDAEESGKLTIAVRNEGKGDAYDVRAVLTVSPPVQGFSFDKEVRFGRIPAGNNATQIALLSGAEGLSSGSVKMTVVLEEKNGFGADPVVLSFRTRALAPPSLVIPDFAIHDQNGTGKVEPMEMVEIVARVQNVGKGDARRVKVGVEAGTNVFLAGGPSEGFDLGTLAPGRYQDVKFSFYTNRNIRNGEKIPISLRISEERPRFGAVRPLAIVMSVPHKAAVEMTVAPSPQGKEKEGEEEIRLATGLSVDVDTKIPAGKKAGPYDVAVVIGNRRYQVPGVPEVAYADRDAGIVREYLRTTFGFKDENILFERDATVATFNEIFGSVAEHRGKLYNYVRKGVSSVFIYYVGHGAPDLSSKEAYFVPVDANPQYIATSGYRLRTFYENMAKLPAKNITIILDTCFSGNTARGMLFRDISPVMVQVGKISDAPKNALVITSSDADQVSSWYPEKRHSLFTYYFLKGLQGEADGNGDGKITTGEMRAWLSEHVPYMARRLNGVEQTPVVMGDDDSEILRLRK